MQQLKNVQTMAVKFYQDHRMAATNLSIISVIALSIIGGLGLLSLGRSLLNRSDNKTLEQHEASEKKKKESKELYDLVMNEDHNQLNITPGALKLVLQKWRAEKPNNDQIATYQQFLKDNLKVKEWQKHHGKSNILSEIQNGYYSLDRNSFVRPITQKMIDICRGQLEEDGLKELLNESLMESFKTAYEYGCLADFIRAGAPCTHHTFLNPSKIIGITQFDNACSVEDLLDFIKACMAREDFDPTCELNDEEDSKCIEKECNLYVNRCARYAKKDERYKPVHRALVDGYTNYKERHPEKSTRVDAILRMPRI